jgi:hypothetical protein
MKTAKISQTIQAGHEIEVTRIELWLSNGKKRIYFDVIDVTDNIKYEGVLYCIAEGRYHAAGDREGLGEWVWAYMQERYAQKKENGGYVWQKFNNTNSTILAIEKCANDRAK